MPRVPGELELFTKKVLIAIGFAVAVTIFWLVREILILVFIAAVLAAGIAPAVRRVRVLGRLWLRRDINRGTAVMIVYLPFLIITVVMLVVLMPRLIADSRELMAHLPELVDTNILTPLERVVPMDAVREQLKDGISIPRATLFGYARGAARAIAAIIAVLFMIVYMLIDAQRLRNLFLLIYPPDRRAEKRRTLTRMGRRMSSWLAGQLILSGIIGVSTFIFLLALRMPYALPLAILAAIGEMIPVIGPILGAIPALAIALLHSRWQFYSMLAFAVLLQKFENLFIAPRVMAKQVQISPLAVFIAFMMGGTLLGIVGAIMAIPAAAIIQVTFEEAFVRHRERRLDVERAGTLLRRVD